MKKSTILGFVLLISFVYLIWPKSAVPKEPLSAKVTKPAKPRKPIEPRKPDRTAALKPLKEIAQRPEVEPAIKRLDPDAKIDESYKNEQAVALKEGYGSFPPVDLTKMNAHKKHVLAALKDPANNSGAISLTGKRKKFDRKRYITDSSYYIDSVEPGRSLDAAMPGPGVKRLERVGASSFRTIQNKTINLSAKTEAGMPLSFTAFDGGQFQNGLSFITVKADSGGVATAEFTPTEGVISQARVGAASPVSSGTLQWNVIVHLNNQTSQLKQEGQK
jgi:hypothetical protein